MKSTKKLVTVVLPQQVLAEAKAVQKKYGISTLSSLLRTALEEKSGVNLKTHKEKTRQISFRVEPETVDMLTKLAKQNGRSLADVVRLLISNVGRISAKKLSVLAVGSRRKSVTKKVVASAKPAKATKPAKAAKSAKPAAPVKKAAPAKKLAVKAVTPKKSVKPSGTAAKAPVKASSKKAVKAPAKKPVPAKKAAVKAPAKKKRR